MRLGQTKTESIKEMQIGILPFGKHKGLHVSEINTDYLMFLLERMELHGDLKDAVEEEVTKRQEEMKCFGMIVYGNEECAKCPFIGRCGAKDEDSIYF